MAKRNWKLYQRIHKSYISILVIIVVLIITVIVASIYNYYNFRDRLITKEQEQLLTIATATSKRLSEFFDEKVTDSSVLVQNIIDDYHNEAIGDDISEFIEYSIDSYAKIQKGKVYKVQFFNADNELMHETYTLEEALDMPTPSLSTIPRREYSSEPEIGEVFRLDTRELAIDIITGVYVDNNHVGNLRVVLKLDTIYKLYVEEIKIGEKGYASVKDSSGILLMHPRKSDIGSNVMVARKKEFPDYDWSELEFLVNEQKQGKTGTGIYHSFWYHDEKTERVKKFSAYAPIVIGDGFWVTTVSMDYKELSDIASQYFYSNTLIAGFIPLILVVLLIYIINLKKNLLYLENEQKYLAQVSQLNQELEKDIEERKVLEKALFASKERFKQLFNAGSDLTFVLFINNDTRKYEISRVNDYACKKLDLERKKLVGKDFLSLDSTMTALDMDAFIESIKEDDTLVYETELTMAGNVKVPVEIAGQVFSLENQNMMMLMARDISKKKAQEEHLEKNRALLIYKFRLVAMGEMIANIAHQWRQPLGSLSLMISNLEDAYVHDDLSEAYFNDVIKNTQSIIQKMSNIIDDFRYFFNPRNEKDYFDPEKQIYIALEMVTDRIKIKEVHIELNNTANKKIFGYPNQFSQVVLNIINNSIDALKSIESDRNIVIDIKNYDSKNLIITIGNNGERLPEGIENKVFDPYFTTKEEKDGTGIGLYMTKMIIETNFIGRISMKNKGNFVVTEIILPIEEIE